jgi:L-serine/L-threonine ammonia-lyase
LWCHVLCVGHVHVHPFDHPDIWQGHSSIVAELNHQLHGAKPDAIILSVGGGGLLNGVVEGLQAVGWGDVPVVAVETEGADSFAAACKAGKLVTLPAITRYIMHKMQASQLHPTHLSVEF